MNSGVLNVRKITVYSILITTIAIILLVVLNSATSSYVTRQQIITMETSTLSNALEEYKNHFGKYPTGDAADIAKQLMGQNTDKLVFIYKNKFHFDPRGNIIDPDGCPYTFSVNSKSVTVKNTGN